MATDPKPTAPGGAPLRGHGVKVPPPKASPLLPEPSIEDSGAFPVVKADLRRANRRTRVIAGLMVVGVAALEMLADVRPSKIVKFFQGEPAAEATVHGLASDEVVMVCRPMPRFVEAKDGGRP